MFFLLNVLFLFSDLVIIFTLFFANDEVKTFTFSLNDLRDTLDKLSDDEAGEPEDSEDRLLSQNTRPISNISHRSLDRHRGSRYHMSSSRNNSSRNNSSRNNSSRGSNNTYNSDFSSVTDCDFGDKPPKYKLRVNIKNGDTLTLGCDINKPSSLSQIRYQLEIRKDVNEYNRIQKDQKNKYHYNLSRTLPNESIKLRAIKRSMHHKSILLKNTNSLIDYNSKEYKDM